MRRRTALLSRSNKSRAPFDQPRARRSPTARKNAFRRRLLFLEQLEDRRLLASLTVNSVADPGNGVCDLTECTLREAILDANGNAGADEIGFNIPGSGVHTIEPLSNLPATSAVTIDGTTQPGFVVGGSRLIELSGINYSSTNPPESVDDDGLSVSGDSAVRGLAINRFNVGIGVAGANNQFEGNYIGTDPAGSLALPNQWGVNLKGSHNRLGTNGDGVNDEAERNIISGNADRGVSFVLSGDHHVIAGNYIGTDATGMYAIAHSRGMVGDVSSTTIAGNVISGNGIGLVFGAGVFDTLVQGNLIGTDRTGNTALPNHEGIDLNSNSQLLIGGTTSEARNVITGNYIGIRIFGGATHIIQGNYIGRTLSGADLGNVFFGILQEGGSVLIGGRLPGEGNVISGNSSGIFLAHYTNGVDTIEGNLIVNNGFRFSIDGTVNQVIGGTAPGAGNTITLNGTGIIVHGSVASNQNRFVGNSIYGNHGLGIDLGFDGVTPNDPLDADTGYNQLQNFPELTAAASAASTRVQGSLHSTPSSNFVLDFYANSAADPSGYGEGERWLGSAIVATDASGNINFDSASFAVLLGASSPGEFITATATDAAGNTSEFSLAIATPLNQPPVLDTLSATSVYENGTVHLTGTYHDPDAQDTHTLTINWGEGSPQIVPVSGGSFDIIHQYLDDNPTNTPSDVYN